MRTLIQNGYIICPQSGQEMQADVLIEDDKVISIAKNLADADNVDRRIDAADCIVAPGLVDVHVHFRDPGFTYKEDIHTGAKAAARGGFTTVVLMANTKPVVDNEETLAYVLQKGRETNIHIETCTTITKGMQGQELVDMAMLKQKGAVGFTDDGIPIMNAEVVKAAMKEAKHLDMPLSFHEENPTLIANNGVNRGKASAHYGIEGSPREAEIDLVERDLKLALETGAKVNIQHISTKEAVELVRQAKKQGGEVHAEATPHHFTLTEEAVIKYGTLAKMNPPLRTEEDRIAIIEGLRDNTIDLIATDHAPHSVEEKEKPIIDAPSGIIGLETALSLGITNLVRPGHLSMMELIKKMSYHPATLYQLDAGTLEEGSVADLVVFAPEEFWIVESYESKSTNSPFTGETLYGKVKYTICSGEIAYTDNCTE